MRARAALFGAAPARHKGRGLEARSLENEAAVARASVAAPLPADASRLAPRRAALIRGGGRIAAAIVPVAVIVLLFVGAPLRDRIGAVLVECVIWSLALGVGYSLGGAAVTALGPRVAVGRGVLLGLVASAAAETWFPWQIGTGAPFLIGAVVFASAAWWESFALRHVTPATRLLMVGASSGTLDLVHDIRSGRGGGYGVIGVVQDSEPHLDSYGGVPVLGRIDDMHDVITASRPDIVVLAPGPNRPQTFQRLLEAAEEGFRVVELAQFYEHAYGRVPVEDLTRAWFMSVLHLYQRPYSQLTKRTVDVVGSCILLVLTLPLFPLLAFFVRQTKGPLILRQLRLGEHGNLFTIYKFRTMRADAEPPGTAIWAGAEDSRITRTGGIMRRLRLDELPQLWNVVRGDMSLVGPRPERPEFLAELNERVPYWTRRHLVKPGITGWAQVRQGYTASAEATSEKLSYDLWYIRHRSLTVDVAILLRTLAVVFRGDGLSRVGLNRMLRQRAAEVPSAEAYDGPRPIPEP
jgi:exopolysaccharide biosynthesis polyprenyl glycosylphosphotransferase